MEKKFFTSAIIKHIKDFLIIICIAELIHVRCSIVGDAYWIGLITYGGFLLSVFDLFLECIVKFNQRKGFGIFLCICLFPLAKSVIVLIDIFTGIYVLDAAVADIYTLVTLGVSLPHNLYINLLGLILSKDRGCKI